MFVFNGLQKAMFQALLPLSKVMNGLTNLQNPYVTKRHSKQFYSLLIPITIICPPHRKFPVNQHLKIQSIRKTSWGMASMFFFIHYISALKIKLSMSIVSSCLDRGIECSSEYRCIFVYNVMSMFIQITYHKNEKRVLHKETKQAFNNKTFEQ